MKLAYTVEIYSSDELERTTNKKCESKQVANRTNVTFATRIPAKHTYTASTSTRNLKGT
jgi:hypothetical protein